MGGPFFKREQVISDPSSMAQWLGHRLELAEKVSQWFSFRDQRGPWPHMSQGQAAPGVMAAVLEASALHTIQKRSPYRFETPDSFGHSKPASAKELSQAFQSMMQFFWERPSVMPWEEPPQALRDGFVDGKVLRLVYASELGLQWPMKLRSALENALDEALLSVELQSEAWTRWAEATGTLQAVLQLDEKALAYPLVRAITDSAEMMAVAPSPDFNALYRQARWTARRRAWQAFVSTSGAKLSGLLKPLINIPEPQFGSALSHVQFMKIDIPDHRRPPGLHLDWGDVELDGEDVELGEAEEWATRELGLVEGETVFLLRVKQGLLLQWHCDHYVGSVRFGGKELKRLSDDRWLLEPPGEDGAVLEFELEDRVERLELE